MQTAYLVSALFAVSACAACAQATLNLTSAVPPGAYRVGPSGQTYHLTNFDGAAYWTGLVKQGPNGLKCRLILSREDDHVWVGVGIGSAQFNCPGELVAPQGNLFRGFELRSADGKIVPFAKGRSPVGSAPARIALRDLPRRPGGGLADVIRFFTNSPPIPLATIRLGDLYRIATEGDYALTVSPIVYRFGTNDLFVDRIDLPTLSTNVHLAPPTNQHR
jgi:hypothetical protein